jgi:hypothetical protein
MKGGDKSRVIHDWHHQGRCSVGLRSATDNSVSGLVSSSSSSSAIEEGQASVLGRERERARDADDPDTSTDGRDDWSGPVERIASRSRA